MKNSLEDHTSDEVPSRDGDVRLLFVVDEVVRHVLTLAQGRDPSSREVFVNEMWSWELRPDLLLPPLKDECKRISHL